jgi:hypothetical protein
VRTQINPKAVRRNPKNGAGTLPGFGWAVGVTQPAISKKATISVTNTTLRSPRACRPSAFMRVARGWMNSVREVSSPDDTTETTGETRRGSLE